MSKRVFSNYFLGRSKGSVLIPANTSILDKITGKNWLVIGDAAITHDPISSYGLNFVLKTSFQAVSVIKWTFNDKYSAILNMNKLLNNNLEDFFWN